MTARPTAERAPQPGELLVREDVVAAQRALLHGGFITEAYRDHLQSPRLDGKR
jgi:hypothetical protein